MRSRAILLGLALACAALLLPAPARADHDGWVSYEDDGGCIGGAKCGENGWALRIRLEDAPVTGVRFHAHDDVGDQSKAHLRVRIDDHVINDDIDVPKNGDWFEYPVDRVRGRYLTFEAFAHDEAVVENIEVQYSGGRGGRGRGDDRGDRGDRGGRGGRGGGRGGDWESYEDDGGCIGGSRCDGGSINIELADAPVLSVHFHAHDDVGDRSRGHLRVRIDGHVLAHDIDVPKDGDDFDLDGERSRGRRLVFEAISGDEVVVEDIEVEYGRGR